MTVTPLHSSTRIIITTGHVPQGMGRKGEGVHIKVDSSVYSWNKGKTGRTRLTRHIQGWTLEGSLRQRERGRGLSVNRERGLSLKLIMIHTNCSLVFVKLVLVLK